MCLKSRKSPGLPFSDLHRQYCRPLSFDVPMSEGRETCLKARGLSYIRCLVCWLGAQMQHYSLVRQIWKHLRYGKLLIESLEERVIDCASITGPWTVSAEMISSTAVLLVNLTCRRLDIRMDSLGSQESKKMEIGSTGTWVFTLGGKLRIYNCKWLECQRFCS